MADWQRQAEGLRHQVQHKEKQCSRSQTEALLFFLLHVAFQGAVLAVSISRHQYDPMSLLCRSMWLPTLISLLAALPLLVTMWLKLSSSENLLLQLEQERSILRDLHGSIQQLRVSGNKFSLRPGKSSSDPKHSGLSQFLHLRMICGFAGFVLASATAFTAVVLVSISRVLCSTGL
jgi:hypothetical protein